MKCHCYLLFHPTSQRHCRRFYYSLENRFSKLAQHPALPPCLSPAISALRSASLYCGSHSGHHLRGTVGHLVWCLYLKVCIPQQTPSVKMIAAVCSVWFTHKGEIPTVLPFSLSFVLLAGINCDTTSLQFVSLEGIIMTWALGSWQRMVSTYLKGQQHYRNKCLLKTPSKAFPLSSLGLWSEEKLREGAKQRKREKEMQCGFITCEDSCQQVGSRHLNSYPWNC